VNPQNPTRILVIEDNETNRALMTYLLKAFGYVALEADDGESGVEIARREQPDLIVCDVHLPKLDGYGVLRELKIDNALENIPVIAVTALAMVGDRDRILAAGFDGYISKPIAPESFVQDIEKSLAPPLRSETKPETTRPTTRSEPASQNIKAARGTILAVDDIQQNLEFIRSTLQPLGYAVMTSYSVESAVTWAREHKPDLVLSDLHMHPENGFSLLARAKAETALAGIPVVIISSTATGTYDERECLAHGAVRFIRRPIEPEALIAEIAAILKENGRGGTP